MIKNSTRYSESLFLSTLAHGKLLLLYLGAEAPWIVSHTLGLCLQMSSLDSQVCVSLSDLGDFKTKWIHAPAKGLSCDLVVDFPMVHERVVIEHAANVTIDPRSTLSASLRHHVYAQAEAYHHALRSRGSAWVLHWTTVKNGTGPNEVVYWFPPSKTVQTVYIYHSPNFREAEIHTSTRSWTVTIPWTHKSSKRKHAPGAFPSFLAFGFPFDYKLVNIYNWHSYINLRYVQMLPNPPRCCSNSVVPLNIFPATYHSHIMLTLVVLFVLKRGGPQRE